MKKKKYKMKGRVWLYPTEKAAWHFVSTGKKESEEIKKNFGTSSRGFGSFPVNVTIGNTRWKTSIFPDSRSGTYILPLKVDVRKKEDIQLDDEIDYTIEIAV